MELLHQIFANQVREIDLIEWVAQDGKENLLKAVIKYIENLTVTATSLRSYQLRFRTKIIFEAQKNLLTWQVLKRLSRIGLVISMKTTSFATPVGKPGSLVSGRALITRRAFFLIRDCAGGSTVKVSISPVGWFTNRKLARPLKSLKADLKKRKRVS